jgi:hypothetical protein
MRFLRTHQNMELTPPEGLQNNMTTPGVRSVVISHGHSRSLFYGAHRVVVLVSPPI